MNERAAIHHPRPRVAGLLLLATLVYGAAGLAQEAEPDPAAEARAQLGHDLMAELLMTEPSTDYSASCAGCHRLGTEVANRPERFYADHTQRSLRPRKDLTRRNTPSFLDLEGAERFGLDGEFETLEDLIRSKLLGLDYGWQAKDEQRAKDNLHYVLTSEGRNGLSGEAYEDQFRAAYGIEIAALEQDAAIAAGARVLADAVRSVRSTRTAPWDAFAQQNRFRAGPNEDEELLNYAAGVESRIWNQEGRRLIKRPEGFTQQAYEGFKAFFRVFGDESVGNCVLCHVPPSFSDQGFHNVGTAQVAYDAIWGDGAFAKLELDAGKRGSEATRSAPSEDDAALVDLGYWNFAPEDALESAVGAFRTPSLRNLARTGPYLHDGSGETLRDVVALKVQLIALAKEDKVRGIAPHMASAILTEADIDPLVAFLEQLDEVGEEGFRHFLINLATD